MTHNRTSDYWISPNALRIELNAMGLPDYVQASCTSGAKILCYIKDVITYDAGHNYRRWTLSASPTAFNTHTPKYVYVAIPRDMTKTTAQVVFPSEQIDIYGKAERATDGTTTEEQVGSTDYYYIFLQGILSSSGDNGTTNREWTPCIDTGTLSSDEAINANNDSEWYQYSTVDEIVTFLKDLTMKAGQKFISLAAQTISIVTNGKIQFGTADGSPYVDGIASSDGTSTESVTQIVTPKYMDDRALSRDKDDSNGTHKLTLGNLQVGTPDQFGNSTVYGTLNIGTYNKGHQGAQIDWYGNAEFESIVARSFLEVPELRYNRTTITVGNKWQTVGAGIIERVWAGTGDNALTGIAKLKLEPTEPGAIAVDDKCQGIFHFVEGNDTQTSDPKNGNYHFAGFTTVYFIVKEIYTADTLPADIKSTLPEDETIGDNQFFRYELRAKTCADLAEGERNRWTDTHHPQPSMHFACYANATNSARQACRLTTTSYQLHLAGMTDWTYTQDNIRLIIGWLDGFTLQKQVWDSAQQKLVQQDKPLEGEGIAVGNMYMWGSIDQFDRAPSVIMQQLYYRSTDTDSAPTGITIATDRKSFTKGTWQTDHILPSPTARYVWQQWLYTYSDGTYAVSGISLYALDNTLLTVTPNRTLVSVAISDWYDPDNPDDVTFDLTAQIKSGTEALAIAAATAQYSSDGATLSYTTQMSADQKTVTYHITLAGYVGIPIDGATPEDTYLTLTLTTALGTGTASVTISQNREGEAGQDGDKGKDGNTPFIRNGNWWVGDTNTGVSARGPKGEDGTGVSLKGTAVKYYEIYGDYESDTDKVSGTYLVYGRVITPSGGGAPQSQQGAYIYTFDAETDSYTIASANKGDTYIVQTDGHMYLADNVGNTSILQWVDCGKMKGADGKSAYDIWLEAGNTGTESDFLEALIGVSGRSVDTIVEYYARSNSKSVPPHANDWGTTIVNPDASHLYLWNKETILDSDGEEITTTTPVVIATYTKDGKGISSITEYYALSTSKSEVTGTWGTSVPTMDTTNRYLWNKETITYTDDTTTNTTPAVIGAYGDPGKNGEDGISPIAITVSGTSITAHKASSTQRFNVYVCAKRGDTVLTYGNDADQFSMSTLADSLTITTGLKWKFATNSDQSQAYYQIALSANAVVNMASIPFKVIINGTEYPYEISFSTVTDGEQGDQGPRGYEGISVRRSEWQEGAYYRNDSADGSADTDGNRYLDEVSITDLATGTADWYVAKAAHNGNLSAASNKPTGSGNDYWQKMNNLSPIRTPYADIQTAFIQYLNLTQLLLKQTDGTVYGAFGAATVSNPYPLWFGGTAPDSAVTKFNADGSASLAGGNLTYDKDGNVTGTGCTFNTVTGTGCSFSNGTFDGILKASLMYGNVKIVDAASLTINPATAPYRTYFIKSTAYNANDANHIYLPSAVTYDGLELQFFRESTGATLKYGVLHVKAGSSEKIYYRQDAVMVKGTSGSDYIVKLLNGSVKNDSLVYYIPMEITTLKAMNGNWYVVSGYIYQG